MVEFIPGPVARLFRGEGFLLATEKNPASEDAGYSKSNTATSSDRLDLKT
jgi:hypothetical protein